MSGTVLGTEDLDMKEANKQESLPTRSWVTVSGRDRALGEQRGDRGGLSKLRVTPSEKMKSG